MDLRLDQQHAFGYKSPSQIARRVTEAWAEHNLYCAACSSGVLDAQAANTRAVDFRCPVCRAAYQLKSVKTWSERRVPDAGYDAMMQAIRSDCVPNLLVMQYSLDWFVRNLLLVPSFFFTPASIQKRKPLAPNARRAGWVGCNILLDRIADDGKIRIIVDGQPLAASGVRERYDEVRPLATMSVATRGWTLDVLGIVRDIGKPRFSLDEVYVREGVLAAAYPNNKHVRPKIRQQLQLLRDMGYVRFEGRGMYSLLR